MSDHLFYQTRQTRPFIERAEGIYLWDAAGQRYLDGASGAMVSNVGHSHPHVLARMSAQMQSATFAYRLHFQSDIVEQFAARLAKKAPKGLDKVFFVSGGSEAVETAIKLARQATLARGEPERFKIMSRLPSYHGSTLGAVAVTGTPPFAEPFAPMMQAMPKVRAPLHYLDGLDPEDPGTAAHYLKEIEEAILAESPESLLAFLVEPVGGASTGALVPPKGYMEGLRALCDKYGLLLIYDEVMTGGGRTGTYFAADQYDAVPDMIISAKGLGGGYMPLGAVISRNDLVDDVLDHGGFLHGFTNAAMPLAAAAGMGVLDVVEEEQLCDRATRIGGVLFDRLRDLQSAYPFIGDVRGKGLLLAFELMADGQSKQVLPKELNAHVKLVNIAYENGLIIYSRRTRNGTEGDHFMICPPLITTAAQTDELVALLDKSLGQFADLYLKEVA
ncbi:aminotransferase family protein [Maritalea mediterranea]|uniref:Aminotransferase class III-fold pyridoxal phosphate-dependent enzyme n=1 Tax=Maritalea mediterranea TaxID=2909667 RepID=A0ABS9EAJ6_9HYPH|nr:aminotransferase class III-fold pyridoxal phosphate-dependent enzyme [Maritalea mediterranea]MCF4099219.1 aminotransferase class III-fold pyridoxal phosphate-dependent enzyme [Maritalea mediterranea]